MGWFHCVGELLEGPEPLVPTGATSSRIDLLPFGDTFEPGVSRKVSLVAAAFEDQPLLQLEFCTHVPWVLAEPAPD